jgi:MFS family permease
MTRKAEYNAQWVGWLSLAQLISWGSIFYTFALLMGPVEDALGMSRAESSLAFSLALLAEGLLAYPVGRLIDRGYERAVMTGGSALLGICLLLHGGISSPQAFYAVWTCMGAGLAATLYPPAFAVVTRRFPNDFRRAIITLTFLGGLASSVFLPLSAWLIHLMGWRHATWPLAALHFGVCLPIHALLLRNAPKRSKPKPDEAVPTMSALSSTFRSHLFSAPFVLVGVFMVLMMGVTAALPAHMVSLLREQQIPEAWVIAIPASIGVLQVLGRLLLYLFERRMELHLANRLIPALIPLGLLALLVAPWLGVAKTSLIALFVVLYGMGNGMLTIVKGTAIAQYVSHDHVASLNGALGVPMALVRAAMPLCVGLLWSQEAGYAYGLTFLLLLSLLAMSALVRAQQISKG